MFSKFIPGLLLLLLAYLMVAVPVIAGFLLGGFFAFLGVMYLFIVYQWHKAQKMMDQMPQAGETFQAEYSYGRDPGVRDFSVMVIKKLKF